MADLSVNIAGVWFKNPVWTSSSEVTENFEKMKRGIDMGAGAVVAKSYTNSREYREPTEIARYAFLGEDRRQVYGRGVPKLYTNYCRTGIGQLEETEDGWFEELVKTQEYAEKFDAKIVGSVFGSTDVQEMIRLSKRMQDIGIPMIELDLACPQGEELHDKGGILKTSQTYVDVTKAVVESVATPVFVKLSPQQADLAVTARAVKDVGAAGVTCHNRFLGFMVDIDEAAPTISGWAGVGGPWMLPISLRWVSKIYADHPDFFILGSNGAYDWEDVVRFLMAGANAVEFCSTIMAKGFYIVRKAVEGLNEFLDRKGYKSVQEIIGVATRASHTYEEMHTLPGYKQKSSIDPDKCIHCGKCLEICWYHGIERKEEKAVAPCKEACLAGIDAARYVRLVGEGKFDEALAVVRERIPFPFVCGIACTHPCETKCARGRLDDPIAIMALKRLAAERDNGSWKSKIKAPKPTGRRVAVVGSGPAGLTAAYYLARLGHGVTVFEASPVIGGMMRVAIPEFRLPMEVLEREIDEIRKAGVEIKTGMKVTSVDELSGQGYNAVFVATGAHRDLRMGVDGEDSTGVMPVMTFLHDVKHGEKVDLGEKVAVIGGGNAALDAARSASRLGARDVTLFYRRSRAEMPAMDEEVEETLLEGVDIEYLTMPTKIAGDNGRLKMQCIRVNLGAPDESGRPGVEPIAGTEFDVEANTIIVAIGGRPDLPDQFGLKRGNGHTVWVDPETLKTSKDGVFAGGDVLTGSASIIEAIAAGRKVAMSIDRHLGGKGEIDEVLASPEAEAVKPLDADELPEERRVPQATAMPLAKRLFSFGITACGYTEEEAIREAGRCLHCDANWIYTVNEDNCKGCYNCKVVCPVEDCINMKVVT